MKKNIFFVVFILEKYALIAAAWNIQNNSHCSRQFLETILWADVLFSLSKVQPKWLKFISEASCFISSHFHLIYPKCEIIFLRLRMCKESKVKIQAIVIPRNFPDFLHQGMNFSHDLNGEESSVQLFDPADELMGAWSP